VIRRFYILPLRPGVPEGRVDEFVRVLNDSDQFIPGLLDSSAGVDFDSRTVLWENTFVDEATYSGPYMVHPYHVSAIDNYVMADSPECITHDIYTSRYQMPGAVPRLDHGIRRLVLMNVAEGSDTSAIDALAAEPAGMATSVLCPDNVGWVSAKGRPWTHIWEQGFTDMAALQRHLDTRDGVAGSSLEGLKRLGVDARAIKVLTCPFALKPLEAQSPADAPPDGALHYAITARTAPDDVEAYIDLLERRYDPFMAGGGGSLVHRWRTVDRSDRSGEVQSVWRLASLAAYSDLRAKTNDDPGWNSFVRDAMPLVKSGTRRFYRAG
jgi:hypothetical protein